MSFGAFNKKNTSIQTSSTESAGSSQSEVGQNAASIIGSSNTVNMLDQGAIKGAFDFSGSALDTAAQLTVDLVTKQAEAGQAALKAAVDATQPDATATANTQKMVMVVVGLLALAWVVKGKI